MSGRLYGPNHQPIWAYHGDRQKYRYEKSKSFYNKIRYYGSGLMGIGDVFKLYDSYNFINDYMSNRDIGWSDILYPSLVQGSGSLGSTVNTLSGDWKSFERLYEDAESEGKKRVRDKIARENDMWRNRYYQSAEQWYSYLYNSSRRR